MGIYNNADQEGLVPDEEEAQKLGVYHPSDLPVTGTPLTGVAGASGGVGGTGMGLMMERTTSSFSNESAAIQARKREAQRTAGRKGSGFYDEAEEYAHGSSEDGYELRNTSPQPLRTPLPASPFTKQPPPARVSEDSEDTRWGISRATAAITGAGAGKVGGFEPIHRSDTGFESATPVGSPDIKSGDDGSRRV